MAQSHTSRNLGTTIVLAACLLGVAGCQSLPKPNLFGQKEPETKNVPQSVVALWKDTVLTQPGAKPSRGLGGRIYFYDETNHPVPVEGKLVVYAYDDSQQQQLNREPDRKYVFDHATLQKHYSESELGPSYSLWLPWDEAGGPHAEVSLIPMLTTTEGKVVIGEHSRHVLGGPDSSLGETDMQISRQSNSLAPAAASAIPSTTPTGEDHSAKPVTYQQEVAPESPRMRSSSIRLPEAVKRRLSNSTDLSDSRLERHRKIQGGTSSPESSSLTTPATPTPPSASPGASSTITRTGVGKLDSPFTTSPLMERKPVEFPTLQTHTLTPP